MPDIELGPDEYRVKGRRRIRRSRDWLSIFAIVAGLWAGAVLTFAHSVPHNQLIMLWVMAFGPGAIVGIIAVLLD